MRVKIPVGKTAPFRPNLIVGLGVLVGSLSGCGSKTDVVALTPSEKNLTNIALAYMEAHDKLGRGPKNADEFAPFLKEFGDPSALMVSPNDNETYFVIWNADPTRGGPGPYQGMFPILAYERKGRGGKRTVTDIRGRPLTIPEGDLSKLTFCRGHKPGSN